MKYTVKLIDLDKYKSITGPRVEVVGGSRPRLTLTHKSTNQKYFFKTYTHNAREVWAECLASHIAELVGLDAQQVTIKKAPRALANAVKARYEKQLPGDWKPVGTLARNIFPKNVGIIYGSAIVQSPSDPITLDYLENQVKKRYYAAEDILQAISDMIVFDVLIGNMDRHHENWGVYETVKYKQQLLFGPRESVQYRKFTPLFDHGSSLMFELGDDKIARMALDSKYIKKYVEDSRFGFLLSISGEKINPFSLIEEHIVNKTSWKKRLKKSIEKVVKLDVLDLADVIVKMPVSETLEYSAERRTVLYKALLLRYNKFVQMYEELL